MIETKVIQVANDPDVINKVNEVWGSFGWSVLNVQITNTQNTKTYTRDLLDYVSGVNTVETTTINYATITYQRNTEMNKYAVLRSTENEFSMCLDELDHLHSIKESSEMSLYIKCGIGLCVILGLSQLIYGKVMLAFAIALGGPIAIGLIYGSTRGKAIAEKNRMIQNQREQIHQRMEEILTQARQLY